MPTADIILSATKAELSALAKPAACWFQTEEVRQSCQSCSRAQETEDCVKDCSDTVHMNSLFKPGHVYFLVS